MLIFLLTLSCFVKAQSSQNIDLDFVLNKIMHSYPGYLDKVNKIEFDKIVESIKKSNVKDTFENLSRLTLYFNDHHLRLFQKFTSSDINKEICIQNLQAIKKSQKGKKLNKYQGYWINDLNSNIIYLSVINDNIFNGYIVESKNNIQKGFCLFKIKRNLQNELITDYYNINRGKRFFLKSSFLSDKVLFCNSFSKWKKLDNYKDGFLKNKIETTKIPGIDLTDSNNIVIKMPTFNREMVKVYDSIFKCNLGKISQSQNLIIDIRNNNGGVVNCFDSLLPYICSDTIKGLGAYRVIDDLMIEGIKKRAIPVLDSKDSVRIQKYYKYLADIIALRDSFIFSKAGVYSTCKSKPNKIKNVAIITNNKCLSAAELMILYLRQSSKVKIFGQKTGGAIDYLNAEEFILPSSNYLFWVASIKRQITKDAPSYDNSGIPPDIDIPETNVDWISFVRKYYEKNELK